MDMLIDFTNCKRVQTSFGGSDRKFGVEYDGSVYMLKFSERHEKRHDISTSYANSIISEYVSSHVSRSIGLPTQETVLGIYKGEYVVGCKDFREKIYGNIEFGEYIRATFDSGDIKRSVKISQIYDALKDVNNDIPIELQKATIERYWDTFVVDALVGNFDRHAGNWGYLTKDNSLSLAPVYDYGSTLLPQLSDEGINQFIGNELEMAKRCLVFPSPTLMVTDERVGKVGYYDMLASNYNEDCTEAVLRMVPKIDLGLINRIIDNTPLIEDIRKEFYKKFIQLRYDLIVQRAYIRCISKEYDVDALNRIASGHQFSESDLMQFMKERNKAIKEFKDNENALALSEENTKEDIELLLIKQKNLIERYGFHSSYVLSTMFSLYDEYSLDDDDDFEI